MFFALGVIPVNNLFVRDGLIVHIPILCSFSPMHALFAVIEADWKDTTTWVLRGGRWLLRRQRLACVRTAVSV